VTKLLRTKLQGLSDRH